MDTKDKQKEQTYQIQAKRGYTFEEKRVVIDEKNLKYFNPKGDDIRFATPLDDLIIKEISADSNKKYHIEVGSKTGKFKLVNFKHSSDHLITKKFKDDLEQAIKNYVSSDNVNKNGSNNNGSDKNDNQTVKTEPNKSSETGLTGIPETNQEKQETQDNTNTNNSNTNTNIVSGISYSDTKLIYEEINTVNNTDTGNIDTKPLETEEEIKIKPKNNVKNLDKETNIEKETITNTKIEKVTQVIPTEPEIPITFSTFINRDSKDSDEIIENITKITSSDFVVKKCYNNSIIETNTPYYINPEIFCTKDSKLNSDILKTTIKQYNKQNSDFSNTSFFIKLLMMICFIYPGYQAYLSNHILFSIFLLIELVLLILWGRITASFTTAASNDYALNKTLKPIHKYYKESLATQINTYIKISSFVNKSQEELTQIITDFAEYKSWHNYITSVDLDKSGIHLNLNMLKEHEKITMKKLDLVTLPDKTILVESNPISKDIIKFYIIEQSNSNFIKTSRLSLYLNVNPKLSFSDLYYKMHFTCLNLLHANLQAKELELDDKKSSTTVVTAGGKVEGTGQSAATATPTPTPNEENKESKEKSQLNNQPEDSKTNIEEDNKTNYSVATKQTIRPAAEIITSNIDSKDKSPINTHMFESLSNKFSNSIVPDNDTINLNEENDTNKKDKDKDIDKDKDQDKDNKENMDNNEIKNKSGVNQSISVKAIDPLLKKENDECIKIANEQLKGFSEVFLKFDWKPLEDKNGLKLVYYDMPGSGIRAIQGECVIDKSPKDVFDFVKEINNKTKYDKNFDSGHIVREIDDVYAIVYNKYKGKFVFSPRDLIMIVKSEYNKDKDSYIFGTSFESSKYPVNKGIERAHCYYGGFIIKKLGDFQTHLNFFSYSDIKLSPILANLPVKELGSCVAVIRKLMTGK